MMRPFFVVSEKGDTAKMAYFGDDITKAQEVFNRLTQDETIDSLQMFHTPIPSSTFNPKAFAAMAKVEEEARQSQEKRSSDLKIQEAQAKLEKGQALVKEAQEALNAANAVPEEAAPKADSDK